MIHTTRTISRALSTNSADKIKILKMLTKTECQLCDKAVATIDEKLAAALRSQMVIEKVDICRPGNEDLYDRWRYEIPVFYLNDKYLCKNSIDIEKLTTRLVDQ